MLDDFTPIVHRLEGRPVKLWAVGDVHLGSKQCNIRAFQSFLRKVQADPDSYVLIVGDILDNCTRDSVGDIFESTMGPMDAIDYAVELFEPVKDRILAAVGGNHEFRSAKSTGLDPLYDVFVMLQIQHLYRQNFCFMRVVLERGNTTDHYALYLTHGKTANKQRRFAQSAIEGVDAIVTGHTHDGLIAKNNRMVFSNRNAITMKPFVSLTACSWIDYGGYASRAQCIPTATCDPQALLLDFTGSNRVDGKIKVVW